MPARKYRQPDPYLEDAKAYCRRFRLRVGDAGQVAKLLAHLRHLNKVLIHPSGARLEFVDYHRDTNAMCADGYTPEWVLGRNTLLFEGTLDPNAGERNDIARLMHSFLDPNGTRSFWHGPVAIAAYSNDYGATLPEQISLPVMRLLSDTHRRAIDEAAAAAAQPSL